MNPTGIIYQATNTVNGKRYIGASRFSLKKRWAEHRYSASSGRKTWLYDALRKYGEDVFEVVQIATCLGDPSEVERIIIQAERPEYNQTNGGEITSGRKHSPETIAKITAGNIGKIRTAEQRAAMSALKKAQYAANPELRAITVANFKKASEASAHSKARIDAVAKACRERIWTQEMREKLSASCVEKYCKLKAIGA